MLQQTENASSGPGLHTEFSKSPMSRWKLPRVAMALRAKRSTRWVLQQAQPQLEGLHAAVELKKLGPEPTKCSISQIASYLELEAHLEKVKCAG